MLVPLSELLGVTVTELLLCRNMGEESLASAQVEELVKTAVSLPTDKTERAYHNKSGWWLIYIASLAVGAAGLLYCLRNNMAGSTMPTVVLMTAVFGAYFCFFVRTRLPQFYDDNAFGLYYDKGVRMNVPGVNFNNRNWPYIVRAVRVWACLTMALYPIVNIAMSYILPELWHSVELYAGLIFMLGGLFFPVYILGKKYE